jgi:hypothetical protein
MWQKFTLIIFLQKILVTTYNNTQLVRHDKELSVTKGELAWVVIQYPVSQIKRSHQMKRTNKKPFGTHMI